MWWHFEESEEGVRRQTFAELLPKLIPLFKPHTRFLYTALGLLLLVTASQLVGPLVLQHIIDKVIPAKDIPGLYATAAVYFIIAAGGAGVGFLQAIALFKLGINITTDLKARLFQHVLGLGLNFHENHPPGKLLSRVESDTETLNQLFSSISIELIRNSILFIGIIAVLFVKNYNIAAWVLLLMPFLFGATFWYISRMRRFWREIRARWAVVLGYVTEYVQGIEVIQQYNYQGRARERMQEVNIGKYRVEVPSMFFEYTFWGGFMFGEIIADVIVLGIGVRGVFAGTVSLGTLVLFIEYIRQVFQPIMQLSEQINFMQRSLVSVERVFGILETKPAVVDGPAPAAELAFKHEIAFENVWFAYEDQPAANGNGADATGASAKPADVAEPHWILRDVSFIIPKGQKIALVGTSGGGKSTIVNLLLRFYDPQRGRITVDGRDIRDFPVAAWRAQSGLVLQDIFLFPGSVVDNLRVFNDKIPQERVEHAAHVAHAGGIIERLPGGYQGDLAERGANLSVGERQLISFARALSTDPPLLVLDEATSSVDPHTERRVQEALDRLLEGRTALIVAHRLSTILHADNIMLIHAGEVAESGRHAELLAQDGLYAKLFKLQFALDEEEPAAGEEQVVEAVEEEGGLPPMPGAMPGIAPAWGEAEG